jgi:hypothetical protein
MCPLSGLLPKVQKQGTKAPPHQARSDGFPPFIAPTNPILFRAPFLRERICIDARGCSSSFGWASLLDL